PVLSSACQRELTCGRDSRPLTAALSCQCCAKAPTRVLGTDSKSDRESCSGVRPDLVETHFAVLAGRDVGGDGEAKRCCCIVGILWGLAAFNQRVDEIVHAEAKTFRPVVWNVVPGARLAVPIQDQCRLVEKGTGTAVDPDDALGPVDFDAVVTGVVLRAYAHAHRRDDFPAAELGYAGVLPTDQSRPVVESVRPKPVDVNPRVHAFDRLGDEEARHVVAMVAVVEAGWAAT